MFRRLPRDEAFFGLLGRTAAHVVAAATELASMLGAADDAERKAIAKRITEIENRGDEATHDLLRSTASAFLTPFDRADLIALARGLDDCLDRIELAADLIRLHRVSDFPPRMGRIVDALVRMGTLTVDTMPRLGAPGSVQDYWIEVNGLENQVRRQHRKLLVDIFESHPMDPVGLQRLLLVADALAAAARAFESVAHTVEDIAVKES